MALKRTHSHDLIEVHIIQINVNIQVIAHRLHDVAELEPEEVVT